MIGMRMCVLFKFLYIFSNHLDIASSHNVGTLCLDWSCILLPGAFDYIDLHFWGSLMMMVLLMECCVVVCMVAKELKEEEKVQKFHFFCLCFLRFCILSVLVIQLFGSNVSTHSSIEFNTVCVSLFNTIMCLFKWRNLCTIPK